MSSDDEDDEDYGCALIIGFAIVGFAVGDKWGSDIGWLVFGSLLIFDVVIWLIIGATVRSGQR